MKPVKTVKQETNPVHPHKHTKTITEYGSEMQKAMNHKMEKQEYKDEYAKNQALKDHLEYSKNNSNQKKKQSLIGKNRRKNKLRCISKQSNNIIQHKTRNKNTS